VRRWGVVQRNVIAMCVPVVNLPAGTRGGRIMKDHEMERERRRQPRQGGVLSLAVALGLAFVAATPVYALQTSSSSGDAVTWSSDVAAILQENCQNCHRPGSVAPMSLLTYDEARPWASVIREMVVSRKMPPWPIDQTIGIQDYKNDISLSPEEIRTIAEWADAGAPSGDLARQPPPKDFPQFGDRWAYEEVYGRPPDLVITSPSYLVRADGGDQWPNPVAEVTGLETERWISAAGLRPGTPESRDVFHHANPILIQDGARSSLVQSAVGTEGFIYPSDAGVLIKPGALVDFGMHLYPAAEDVDAVLEIGLWFYPEDSPPQFATPGEVVFEIAQNTGFGGYPGVATDPQIVRRGDLLIPPNRRVAYRGFYTFEQPVRLHSLRGHMHLRGKYQIVEVIYPDGRWEVIGKLDWDHPWHTAFLYEDHAMPLLPTGTTMILTSVFDNTADNPYNPDPDQWVVAGARTADEMSHLRFGVTYLEEEDYRRLVEERERMLADVAQRGGDSVSAADDR